MPVYFTSQRKTRNTKNNHKCRRTEIM